MGDWGRRRLAFWLFVLAVVGSDCFGQQWTRFRGPNGSGVSRAQTIPAEWTEADFNWRVKLPGVGHSSPVLWKDRIFLTAADEQTGAKSALCLRADDGRLLWVRRFEASVHRKHQLNSFASSTPTVDADRVYFLWTTPDERTVQALDHAGNELWQTSLGSYKAGHGAGVSPILHDGLVIVADDQEGQSSVAALDVRTGKVRWRTLRETKVAYSTPCIYRRPGRPAEIILTSWKRGITSIDPRDGRINWEIAVFDEKHTETSIGSPITAGDLVLGTCGWLGYATHTVAVRPDVSQPGKADVVYRVDRGAPLTTTPIVVGGLLFLWADEGIVTCVRSDTGELVWRRRVGGTYYGSPVAADGRLYCMSTDGRAVVLAADERYRLIARNPLGEGSHSTPAVAGGVMYLRTFSHLISIGGRTDDE